MSGGILCESRQVGLHVKAQKEWYISVVFSKTLHFQMKRPSVPSQRWGHWPTIIHKDFIIYKRLCTWSGTVYIWAASYWGGSRNLLKIIDKIWRPLLVRNPCFSRHLDRHDIATFAIQLVNIKLQKAFGFDKYYQLPIQSQCPCPIITFEIKKWSNPLRLLGQCLVPRPPFLPVSLFA